MRSAKLRLSSRRQMLTAAKPAVDHAWYVGGITGTICEEPTYLDI